MTAINWQFGFDGSWSDSSKWTPAVLPTSSDDVTIDAAGTYRVTLGQSNFAASLNLNAAGATLTEGANGVLTVAGVVNLQAGTMTLRGSNSIGSFNQSGGLLQLYNANALGSGTLSLTGGELSGMATETIGNGLTMGGSAFIIDAAAGTTLNIGGGGWYLDASAGAKVQFGSSTRTGTVVWLTPIGDLSQSYSHSVDIEGGTLKGGDDNFFFLFAYDNQTTVAAGATLDLAGYDINSGGPLYGFGDIVNSGASRATLSLSSGVFAGHISTDIAVGITGDTIFLTAQSYTGGTTIYSGATLFLEGVNDGIVGDVVTNGLLYNFSDGGVLTLGVVSGTGAVRQESLGTLVLNQINTYSGGTDIAAGVVSVAKNKSLGTGAVTLSSAELLAAANVTLANKLTLFDGATLAAAAGKTLTIAASDLEAGAAGLTLTIGDSANQGTVAINNGGTIGDFTGLHLKVAYGTLKAGDGLNSLTTPAADVTVAQGATLDLTGHSLFLPNLTADGLITSSTVTATVFTLGTTTVSGRIVGKVGLQVHDGTTVLTGANNYSGSTVIEGGTTLQIGDGGATGSIVGDVVDNGSLVVDKSAATTLTGVISGTGTFTQNGKGTTTLKGANTYSGGTTINGGVLKVDNGAALGSGGLIMNGAELLATGTFGLAATQNGANTFSLTGANTIAAAHGQTLSIGGALLSIGKGAALIFGDGANDGTVVFTIHSGSATTPYYLQVDAGTLKAGDQYLSQVTQGASSTTVAANATLDLGGFDMIVGQLQGAGTVTNAGAATLTVNAGAFSGAITGKIALSVQGAVTLTGASTYTGGTTIGSGYALTLGDGGAKGSIVGDIDDEGALIVNKSSVSILAGVISGAGSLTQSGAGTTRLNAANTYSGGTKINGGVLAATNGGALGTGGVTMANGELLATADLTLTNALTLQDNAVLAAVTGATLTIAASDLERGSANPLIITIGDAAHKGTVVLGGGKAGDFTGDHLDVDFGTLRAGSNFSALTDNAADVTVALGATLDLAGVAVYLPNLTGAGVITSAIGTIVSTKGTAAFSGRITGQLGLWVSDGVTTLTGANTYSSGTKIFAASTLRIGDGGATGSIVGAIVDAGALIVNKSAATTLNGVISGAGSFTQSGSGTTTLKGVNSYSGGTTISAGVLAVTNGSALGTGDVTVDNAELLATASLTLTNKITLRGAATLGATTGRTLTINASNIQFDALANPLTLTIGDSAHAGTVALGSAGGYGASVSFPVHLNVAYGTARNAAGLSYLSGFASDVTVALGATLDVSGNSMYLPTLTSAGTITSATAATISTRGTSSASGKITGKLTLHVLDGVTTLTGANTYSGGTTIEGASALRIGDGGATGGIVGDIDDEGALIVNKSAATTLNGVISGAGTFTQSGKGTTTLKGVNTYSGGTTISAGVLAVTKGAALGTGAVILDNAELLATADVTLTNKITLHNNATLAATSGKTLTIDSSDLEFDASSNPLTLTIGDSAHAGTVALGYHTAAGVSFANPIHINVAFGTAKENGGLGAVTQYASDVNVSLGATLDVNGGLLILPNLTAGGTITSGAKSGRIYTQGSSTVAGKITGQLALDVAGGVTTLTGANSYSGGTTIHAAATLKLGDGGATGSMVGNIENTGALIVNETGAVSLTGIISGAGTFTQAGTGTTTLSGVSSYTGGTTIQKGVLASSNSKALGVGGTVAVTTGGEFLALTSQAFSHDLHTKAAAIIAAAHGTTLNFSTGADTFETGKIRFGEGVNDGTIVFKSSGGLTFTDAAHTFVQVDAGVLKAGDASLDVMLSTVAGTGIAAGGTVDIGGRAMDIRSLTGAGTLTNTGAATTMSLFGTTNFSGVISGKFSTIDILGSATLSGDETFTGAAEINVGASLTLSGLWNEAVRFNGGGALILKAPGRFTGTLQGFGAGSSVDLRNISTGAAASLAYDSVTHVLTVSDGTHTDNLTITGPLTVSNFAAAADGVGGTTISWQAPPPAPPPAHAPIQVQVAHRFVAAMAAFAPSPAATGHPPIRPPATSPVHLAVARM